MKLDIGRRLLNSLTGYNKMNTLSAPIKLPIIEGNELRHIARSYWSEERKQIVQLLIHIARENAEKGRLKKEQIKFDSICPLVGINPREEQEALLSFVKEDLKRTGIDMLFSCGYDYIHLYW